MKKLSSLIALTCVSLQLCAAEQKVGIVNFSSCITESKLGKQEQNAFETMRKQIVSLVEDTSKQLQEVSQQLQDKDHLDGLSKEGEMALLNKQAQLNEELNRYQQEYYKFMNQGQYQIVQSVVGGVSGAAEHIAASKGFTMILNKEACFYAAPTLDITAELINVMDKNFDKEVAKQESKVEQQ